MLTKKGCPYIPSTFIQNLRPSLETLVLHIGINSFPDPDLNRKATNYKDNHIHKDAAEIILHFINGKY